MRELASSLRRISRELPKEMREINRRVAEPVAERAQRIGPKRSGRLVGSVRPLATQNNARVAVGRKTIPYAGPIYFGWAARNIEPNRFIDRAIDQLEGRVRRQFEQEVDEFVRGVWSKWG